LADYSIFSILQKKGQRYETVKMGAGDRDYGGGDMYFGVYFHAAGIYGDGTG
jgi:hypothetical protein